MKKIITLALAVVSTIALAGTIRLDNPLPHSYTFNAGKGVYVENNSLCVTTNGGATWSGKSISFPDEGVFTRAKDLNVVEVFGNTIIAAGYNGMLVKSTDNGVTWNVRRLNNDWGSNYDTDFMISSFANENTGAFITAHGAVWMKKNAASDFSTTTTWYDPETGLFEEGDLNSGMTDIDFRKTTSTNSAYGWLLAGRNCVSRFSLLAGNWRITKVLPFMANAICHLPGQDAGKAIVVGDNGKIGRLSDAGRVLEEIVTPVSDYTLYDVHFYDANYGYAVGSKNVVNGFNNKRNVIIKTTDGGTTWTKLYEKATENKMWKGFAILRRGCSLTNPSTALLSPVNDIYVWDTDVNPNHDTAYSSEHNSSNMTDAPNTLNGNSLGRVYSDAMPVIDLAPAMIEENNGVEKLTVNNNYPNPFNPETSISFTLPKADQVKISVMNVQGQEIAILANQQFAAGVNQVKWNAANQTSGLYFYKISTPTESITKQMLLTK